jgi:hypothetical protein
MLLVNRDWEPISLGNNSSFSVIDIIVLCVSCSRFVISNPTAVPGSALRLSMALGNYGLHDFLKMTEVAILGLANRRYCQDRRAEAIMSAVGATKWFKISSSDPREAETVLRQYPLSFVNEVRDYMGSSIFFTSIPGLGFTGVLDRFFGSHGRDYSGALDAVGSLLPFSFGSDTFVMINGRPTPHPSVATSTIEKSGSVRIPAGIVMSSDGDRSWGHPCVVMGPFTSTGWYY